MLFISLVLVFCQIGCGFSRDEILEKFMSFETSFISDLENYIESQESVLQLLRKKLLNFKVEHSDAIENPEAYFSNELNKFLIVKRLASDINLLSDKTFDVANKFKLKADAYRNDKLLPKEDDLRESAISIAKLQKAQNLRTDKLAKGIFGSIKRRNGLSTEDCYQIGKQLNFAQVYSPAIEWLTEAMKRYDEYYDMHQVRAVDILEELVLSFLGNNQLEEAEKVVEKISRMDANSRVIKLFRTKRKSLVIGKMKKKRSLNEVESRRLKTNEELCHLNYFLRSNVFTCPI